ncbi:MAG TPA: laccase domain-containing protein, partial [Burkholderiaceae bacterium]|nr:laccase domain-containing protein [Burkholderiaceae bacterium]
GLSAGVLERCAQAVCGGASCEPHELVAWLGPCIGPDAFEVGADVLHAFGVEPGPAGGERFRYQPRADGNPRWRADLAGLARDRLAALGVQRVSGGAWCTVQERSRFFSFRRDGVTGRMAAAVWIRR